MQALSRQSTAARFAHAHMPPGIQSWIRNLRVSPAALKESADYSKEDVQREKEKELKGELEPFCTLCKLNKSLACGAPTDHAHLQPYFASIPLTLAVAEFALAHRSWSSNYRLTPAYSQTCLPHLLAT